MWGVETSSATSGDRIGRRGGGQCRLWPEDTVRTSTYEYETLWANMTTVSVSSSSRLQGKT